MKTEIQLSTIEVKAVVKHAREIFTKLAHPGPGLTKANRKGMEATAETAIALAELFQQKLKEKGYGEL